MPSCLIFNPNRSVNWIWIFLLLFSKGLLHATFCLDTKDYSFCFKYLKFITHITVSKVLDLKGSECLNSLAVCTLISLTVLTARSLYVQLHCMLQLPTSICAIYFSVDFIKICHLQRPSRFNQTIWWDLTANPIFRHHCFYCLYASHSLLAILVLFQKFTAVFTKILYLQSKRKRPFRYVRGCVYMSVHTYVCVCIWLSISVKFFEFSLQLRLW